MFDLGIEGATVVTAAGMVRKHVYVAAGRIAAVSTDQHPARTRVDATSLLLMPGMVDTHVHLMEPSAPHREDFPSGTAAAARAGVTTVVEHTHSGPVRTVFDLRDKQAALAGRSRVDFGLAAHAWPDRIDEVASLWSAGVCFFKVFTCSTHGVPGFDAAGLLALFRRIAAVGATCLVHCEDESITAAVERSLRAAGRDDPLVLVEWRSREAELTALAVTSLLAERTRARVVIAHVSHVEALDVLSERHLADTAVVAETCPQYLTLLESEVERLGPLRKFTPPARARNRRDLDEMWQELARGRVHHVATDHAPATLAQKISGSIWDAPFGLPGLDTTLPILLDGAHAGRLTYTRVVEVYSERPARLYGLFPRKGCLAAAADADLVLVDPALRWTVADSDILSKAGWSPYSGSTLTGRPVRTYLRGELAVDEGRVLAEPGAGRFLPGPGAARASKPPFPLG